MEENYTLKKILLRGALSGILFTCLWSAWAYYANSAYGQAVATRAAITQGSFTIVNAFVYTVVMEYMFAKGKTKTTRLLFAFVLPNVAVTIVLISIHYLRGTPNVLATVWPSLTIVYTLSLGYVLVVGPRKLRPLSN